MSHVFRGDKILKRLPLIYRMTAPRNLAHHRLDFCQKPGDVAELGVVAGAVHRATAGVTEDDDCLRAGLGRGEFKAP